MGRRSNSGLPVCFAVARNDAQARYALNAWPHRKFPLPQRIVTR